MFFERRGGSMVPSMLCMALIFRSARQKSFLTHDDYAIAAAEMPRFCGSPWRSSTRQPLASASKDELPAHCDAASARMAVGEARYRVIEDGFDETWRLPCVCACTCSTQWSSDGICLSLRHDFPRPPGLDASLGILVRARRPAAVG